MRWRWRGRGIYRPFCHVPSPSLIAAARTAQFVSSADRGMPMRRLLVTIFLASLLGGSAHAQASRDASDPKARALMAELRAASGGQALDRHAAFHETGTIIR